MLEAGSAKRADSQVGMLSPGSVAGSQTQLVER